MKTVIISKGPWYTKGDYTKSWAYKIVLKDDANRITNVWFRDTLENIEADAKDFFKNQKYLDTNLVIL